MSKYSVLVNPLDSEGYKEFSDFAQKLYQGDPFYKTPDAPNAAQNPQRVVVSCNGEIIAGACIVENPWLRHEQKKTALLGWYECANDPAAATVLFDAVLNYCHNAGFTSIVGPMNGSTWHRYRFVVPTSESPFFLDVYNKPWYIDQWLSNGFTIAGNYYSTRLPAVPLPDDAVTMQNNEQGLRLRMIDVSQFDSELRLLHSLSMEGFRDNYLFSPIDLDEFVEMYQPLQPLINPRFVLFAEDAKSAPVGFVFAVDNRYEQQHKSLVMKSATVLPEYRGQGIGHILLATVHQAAFELGYHEVIHALMSKGNISARILAESSKPYREYQLFSRSL